MRSLPWKAIAIHTFVGWHLFIFAAEYLPRPTVFQERLYQDTQFYRARTGLWEGATNFFAPNAPTSVSFFEAKATYMDGTNSWWRSPDWSKMSAFDKLLNCRLIKYFDNIRQPAHSHAWRPLAFYLASRLQQKDKILKHIELIRHTRKIAPPESGWYQPIAATQLLPGENDSFFKGDY